MAKYEPLGAWLRKQDGRRSITLGFADIEQLIEGALPSSAHRHRA